MHDSTSPWECGQSTCFEIAWSRHASLERPHIVSSLLPRDLTEESSAKPIKDFRSRQFKSAGINSSTVEAA
jgi:hypothetical protein